MRHGNKINKLSRKYGHRKALLSNLAASLIKHKRIQTTVAKAKALRVYVEPLITRCKSDTTHSRRMVFRKLQDKEAVQELFDEVASKIGTRPGGYLRIIRLGNRPGDNAEMALVELVDYNEIYTKEEKKKTGGKKRRRTRRGGSGSGGDQPAAGKQESESAGDVAEAPSQAGDLEEETITSEEATEKIEEMADAAQTEEDTQETPEAQKPEGQEVAEEIGKTEDTGDSGDTGDTEVKDSKETPKAEAEGDEPKKEDDAGGDYTDTKEDDEKKEEK